MTQYLTGKEAAALLGVSHRTLYRWMEAGKLGSEEWTVERLDARRAELLARPPSRPHCAGCGTRNTDLFSPNPCRPSGYAAECRACAAARMRQMRERRKQQ